jgi:methyl-accepting chemotaxis protein
VFGWLTGSDRAASQPAVQNRRADPSVSQWVISSISTLRRRLVDRVERLNRMTNDEVASAGQLLNDVVERARRYVQESQQALGRLEGNGEDSVGQLLSSQSKLLRDHAREMSGRAAQQDERARQAAAAAKSIGDLAASIDRLAGEARLLAVNARIESARLGAHSAGFEVLASEMQRLSDEVAVANDRVAELAARLGDDLPWIAEHANDLRRTMESFTKVSANQLEETERSVTHLRSEVLNLSRAGSVAVEDILRDSRAALSHLQFQDVVSQELRAIDGRIRETQVEVAQALDADPATIAAIPQADYVTLGAADENVPQVAQAGEVTLF